MAHVSSTWMATAAEAPANVAAFIETPMVGEAGSFGAALERLQVASPPASMVVLPWVATTAAREGFRKAHALLPSSGHASSRARGEAAVVAAALQGPQVRVYMGAGDGWSRPLQLGSGQLPGSGVRLEAAGFKQDWLHLLAPAG